MSRIPLNNTTVTMFSEMAREKGHAVPANPLQGFGTIEGIAGNSEGVAAWKVVDHEETAEWIRATYLAYFDDINQVRLYTAETGPDGQSRRKVSYSWRLLKSGADHTLFMTSDSIEDLREKLQPKDPGSRPNRSEETTKAMAEMMKPMFQDFRMAFSVTVPGPIRSSEGFLSTEGRSASIALDGELLLASAARPQGAEADRLRQLSGAKESRLSWSDSSITDSEMEEWKKELKAAKAEWRKKTGAPAEDPAEAAPETKAPARPEPPLDQDEVRRRLIRSQIDAAKKFIDSGNKAQAAVILRNITLDYPNHAATKEAQLLLEKLQK